MDTSPHPTGRPRPWTALAAAVLMIGVAIGLYAFVRRDLLVNRGRGDDILLNQLSQADYRVQVDIRHKWIVGSIQALADHDHVPLPPQPVFGELPPTYGAVAQPASR